MGLYSKKEDKLLLPKNIQIVHVIQGHAEHPAQL